MTDPIKISGHTLKMFMTKTQIQRRQKQLRSYEKNKVVVVLTLPNKKAFKQWKELMNGWWSEYSWRVQDKTGATRG